MQRLQVRPHGAPARAALWEAIDAVKATDAVTPVTVVPPSAFAGLALRRALANRPGHGGVVNVRFLRLAQLAAMLSGPVLATARPLTSALRAEAVRAVVTDAPGAFAGVAGHPATIRSLESTFRDLRRAPPASMAALAARPEPAASVARLYDAFRARTAAFADEEDVAGTAAEAAAGGAPVLAELGHVVVYLPARLSPAEWSLLRALADRRSLTVVLGRTGDPDVDATVDGATLERFTELLGPPAITTDGAAPAAATIVSAPDPEDEVRAVLRLVMERVRGGTPLHRIAVLYRQADPYARLARELLDAGGIAWTGPGTRCLADTVAGRVLLGLLQLPEGGFRRDEVAALLTSGPVLDPATGRPVPAARWDVLSRRAGVVGGTDQWRTRLERHVRATTAELDSARGDDETPDALTRRLETDLEQLGSLTEFVDDLAVRLTPPEPADWPALTAWARGLLRAYLGGAGRRAHWPEVEVDAAQRIDRALEGLAGLAEIRRATDLATFVRAVAAELDAPVGRIGRFGHGAFVGPVRNAYGGDFDVVYVLGLTEGAFPPRSRDDPVLPDRDREVAAPDTVSRRVLRRAEERRDHLAALAAAPERVLSFPRADTRAQRRRLPARWLLESAGALAGRTLGAEELLALRPAPWLHVVPSFEAGLGAPGEPGSVTEYDLRHLREWREGARPLAGHPLVAADPGLRAGVAAIDARRSPRFTPFDGLVGPTPALRPSADHPLSPTSLEDWARCPFRYLLGRVLRLREIERPEDTETISPLERGSLVHAVLEEFIDSADPRTSPTQPWSSAERELLLAITERHCDAAEADGVTGRPLRWRLERRRILRELATVLDSDEDVRAELGVVPASGGREVGFGWSGTEPLVVTLPDGRAVAFRGRIDRVDRSTDGTRTVVFDYKTGGAPRDNPRDELRAGRRLQLPVYALATGAANADVHAYYWYVGVPGVAGLAGYPLDDDALADFHKVLTTILDGVEGGVFPAYPGDTRGDRTGRETWENCAYCPYDRLCPSAREDLWERKRDHSVVVGFRGLAEPAEPTPAEEGG
jgi:ATP-dependent helicase/nuclease subunit B